jgi:LCP family protein required for cell wall assembly
MHAPEGPRPRARSPFVAAVLSLFFPGLGHAYAGAYQRALGWAALPILMIALGAGVLLRAHPGDLISLVLTPWVLPGVFVLNILALLYRALATVDAYRVTVFLNAAATSGGGRLGRPKLIFNPISIAGLLAVILVMAGGHAVVARYDLIALDALGDQCVFIGDTPSNVNCDQGSASPSGSPGATESGDIGSPSPTITEPPVQGSALPNVTIPPWDGKERLNILLIGTDQRPKEGTYNTDTLIVVSIDPTTKQVAMFSLPRDTVNVPLPPGPLRNAYSHGVYPKKINALFTSVRNRPDLVAGTDRTRGYNALKETLGNLYGLDIKYFVEVNFDGFKQIVDTMGGVTINVQMPVSDDRFPSVDGSLRRIYIPSGIQHMNGVEALQYARSRHGSNDFDRGIRQQRVLLSLREQADPQALIPQLPALVQALQKTVKTDIPVDQLAPLLGLASEIDTKNIRSYVFAPPFYQKEYLSSPRGYIIDPYVGRIRSAVQEAFSSNPSDEAERQKLAQEAANLWVLNGTADNQRGTKLAGFLEWRGITASAPRQKPAGAVPAQTKIVAYNGALQDNPDTVAYLEQTFGVTVTEANDPAIRTDFILTVGKNTPNLDAPLAP